MVQKRRRCKGGRPASAPAAAAANSARAKISGIERAAAGAFAFPRGPRYSMPVGPGINANPRVWARRSAGMPREARVPCQPRPAPAAPGGLEPSRPQDSIFPANRERRCPTAPPHGPQSPPTSQANLRGCQRPPIELQKSPCSRGCASVPGGRAVCTGVVQVYARGRARLGAKLACLGKTAGEGVATWGGRAENNDGNGQRRGISSAGTISLVASERLAAWFEGAT